MRLSSVANSIRLTKAFSENEFEMGISALATRLGLAKSTVHRLATTLVEYDILEQNRETGKYRLGLALFELGTLRAPQDGRVPRSRASRCTALRRDDGRDGAARGARPPERALHPHPREPPGGKRCPPSPGSRAPAHCTSVGKALLAHPGAPEIVKQVIENGLMQRYTANTDHRSGGASGGARVGAAPQGLRDRRRGDRGGLRCVAAPVRDHTGHVIAAISVAAPGAAHEQEERPDHGARRRRGGRGHLAAPGLPAVAFQRPRPGE